MRSVKVEYDEILPNSCPPAEASDVALNSIYRLSVEENFDKESFKSYAALGKPAPKKADPCGWASCSLMYEAHTVKLLPKFKRFKWAARLDIPAGSGMSKQTGYHVDFWRRKDFDVTGAILGIEKL